jgi:membrane protein DedA with SNARE-associated domain
MKHWLILAAIVAGFCGSVIWFIANPPCRFAPNAQHCDDGDLQTAIVAIIFVAVCAAGLIYATRWLKDRDR